MRLAPSLLRFSCGAGLFVLVSSIGVICAGEARADAGGAPAASPDDMHLDLGGATLETRRVAHGSFTMGASPSEVGHEKDEEPAHHVTISKDYWIGKYPVTRGQFAKFVADTRYVTDAEKGQSGGAGWAGAGAVPDGGKGGPVLVQRKDFTWRNPGFTQTDEHPVVLVSYGDANAFVGWASRKSGKRVRLPTEAEWEFATRGGTTTSWSGGASAESDPASYGWFRSNAGNGTRPVGQKKPNPLGLFDMSGNVMEWCRDVYAPYHEGALVDPEVTTNTGSEPERRVLRGGSWFRDPKRGRSAARYKNTPGTRNADNGFRVVVTNEELVVPGVTGPGPDFVPSAPLGATGPGNGAGTAASASSSGGGSSGPLADGEPIRTEPVGHPGDAFSWGLLLASPVAAASAVVAWMLLRRKRTPGATARAAAAAAAAAARAAGAAKGAAPNTAGFSTRARTDGFVVIAPNAAPGARVRYECIVNGTQVSDVVPLDGGRETFVYTGPPPTAIRILEILDAPAGRPGYRTPDRPLAPASVPPPVPSSRRPPPAPPSRPPPVPSSRPNVTNVVIATNVVNEVHVHTTHRDSPRHVETIDAPHIPISASSAPAPYVPRAYDDQDEPMTTNEEPKRISIAAGVVALDTDSEVLAAAETVTTSKMTSEQAFAVAALPTPSEAARAAEPAEPDDATTTPLHMGERPISIGPTSDSAPLGSPSALPPSSDEAFLGHPRAY
jgi:formylglycine-generating enzyme required for sulfatase activity